MPKQPSSAVTAQKRAAELAGSMGLELVDVELCKESAGRFLRFYIDKPMGVSIDDCEAFHRRMLKLAEDIDYDYMEVSSPGVDRPLKKQNDFDRAVGDMVEVRLYKPKDGVKIFTGSLVGLKDGAVTIDSAASGVMSFEQREVALVKKVFDFDERILEDEDEPIN